MLLLSILQILSLVDRFIAKVIYSDIHDFLMHKITCYFTICVIYLQLTHYLFINDIVRHWRYWIRAYTGSTTNINIDKL